MATWQNDGVLDYGEADDTLALRFICMGRRSRRILLAIHVSQLKDSLVVEELLLDKFETEGIVRLNGKGTTGELDGLLCSTLIIIGKDWLDGDYDREEVFTVVCQVLHGVIAEVQTADTLRELLPEAGAELVSIRCTIPLMVSIEEERYGWGVSNLSGTDIDRDQTLVVWIEHKLKLVLVCSIICRHQLDGFFANTGVIFQSDALFDTSLHSKFKIKGMLAILTADLPH